MKSIKPEEIHTLKGAIKFAYENGPHRLEAVAEELGLSVGLLRNWGNEDVEDKYPNGKHLVPFMRATQSIVPLQFMARQLGAVCCKLPDVSARPLKEIQAGLLDTVKEVGEAIGAYEEARWGQGEAGKRITANEKAKLALAVEEAVIAVLMVQRVVESLKAD